METWQVDAVRLPLWLPRADGRRLRAFRVTCWKDDEERVLASEVGTEAELPALLEEILAKASRKWSALPARVEVADAGLAGLLEPILTPRSIPVEKVAAMPEELRRIQGLLLDQLTPPDPRPSPLSAPGVTLARLAAFARAAAAFYESPIWLHLTSFDTIRVEAPEVEVDLRELAVESGFGLGRPLPALEFLGGDDWEAEGNWVVELERPWNAPPDDIDLWERYALPWVGGDLCPVAWYEDEHPERPDRRTLAFFEGLLLALAATGEEDLDAGRWEKVAPTADGPVRFVLSLPGLVDAEPAREPEGETAAERALDLMEQARSAPGRRGIVLARRAVEVWPGCAEAWLFLSRIAVSVETAHEVMARGVAAGRAALAPESLPFQRLLQRFGDTLTMRKRCEEAAAAYSELLELAPHDPVGARYGFANVLLALGRDAEAGDLLERFGDDSAALLAWPRVLLGFRREGDCLETRRLLKNAQRSNGLVVNLLLGTPLTVPWSPLAGDRTEAGLYLLLSCGTWETTPGALAWLRARVAPALPVKNGKSRRLKKGKRRRR
ncbi:MAG TPA: tetratricopeptide repeat protein [Thermoanaerobaculia bacterium]